MRLGPVLLALVWGSTAPLGFAVAQTVPDRLACDRRAPQQDDDQPSSDLSRRTSSKDPCAVADDNLKRDEAEILRPKPAVAAAPRKDWDRKSKPRFLGSIARRFELQAPELAAIGRAGFAVPARLEMPSYAFGYHEIFQSQLPVYITADSIFHAIFASHQTIVEKLETARLSPLLSRVLDDMHCALAAAATDYPAEVVRDLDLYLLVARRLLATEDQPARSASGDAAVEREAAELVGKATAASDLATVTLFGRQRLVDFTQYGPRGHYASQEGLQRYFRAAMWASRLEFNLVSRSSRSSAPGPMPDPTETPREALA
ncbi:MAG: DUF3160 domain-containing protein, partial [Alphaproteobacteria bacterium]|nr:DUF3160 domain-containing protein [Alphaproteobacteria bacterium]